MWHLWFAVLHVYKLFFRDDSVSLLLMLTEEMNLQHLLVKIGSSLKRSEDIELNLGWYKMIKSVLGSFSQGNVPLLG